MTAPKPTPAPASSPRRADEEPWLVVVASSAGGIKPLIALVAALPADFPAPVVVVQHRSDHLPNLLHTVLAPRSALPVRDAHDGEPFLPGNVYLCPPGLHLAVEAAPRVFDAPKINYVRPSADLLFYSAAQTYGHRTIGVVLSGTGADGALGCRAIVDAGGTVIAQTAESCVYPSMPNAAATLAPAQLVLAPEAIGPALQRLIATPSLSPQPPSPPAASHPATQRTKTTTVLLADDHTIIREGLRVLLRADPSLTIVAEAADGHAAVAAAAASVPDVVVMDLAMPELDGIEATRQICARQPAVKVIILSAQTDLESISRAFQAGAVGFIGKQKAFDELLQAIRTTVSTGEYFGRDLRKPPPH